MTEFELGFHQSVQLAGTHNWAYQHRHSIERLKPTLIFINYINTIKIDKIEL